MKKIRLDDFICSFNKLLLKSTGANSVSGSRNIRPKNKLFLPLRGHSLAEEKDKLTYYDTAYIYLEYVENSQEKLSSLMIQHLS